MSCCGKKRKASDPNRPTLASPIGLLRPRVAAPPRPAEPRRGDVSRDASVTDGR
jgi:hypothetical protein